MLYEGCRSVVKIQNSSSTFITAGPGRPVFLGPRSARSAPPGPGWRPRARRSLLDSGPYSGDDSDAALRDASGYHGRTLRSESDRDSDSERSVRPIGPSRTRATPLPRPHPPACPARRPSRSSRVTALRRTLRLHSYPSLPRSAGPASPDVLRAGSGGISNHTTPSLEY